ncbi:DUF86 domain-containing protein [Candidatus Woesearchaeota archaeon]|nr:DUF86 domain-containing protein [Candidatus Woesearchaeota archaeon]MCF8013072.1 DUF86 domain-containing protein [Candidatus Woesearchaeota archaeon]
MEKYSMRINNKIKDLNKHIFQLEKVLPNNSDSYKSNYVVSAACERLAEIIIEEIIKISNIILKEKGILERGKSFEILKDLNILSETTYNKMQSFKGMRNLMIHQYDDFDEELFYESLKEIIIDAKKFQEEIVK